MINIGALVNNDRIDFRHRQRPLFYAQDPKKSTNITSNELVKISHI